MSSSPAVLLVEADPTQQLIALSMLRHLGVEADTATDGSAAVERAAGRAYDVVLLSERVGGAAIRDAIRARRPAGGLRIVAVTERADSSATDRLCADGFDGAIHKPLSVAALEAAVRPPEPAGLLVTVRGHVRELLGEDDEAFVAELVEAFDGSARQALAAVAAARAAGDVEGVAASAHALKGSAANVGLDTLTDVWDAVETGARRGEPSALDGSLTTAVAETERALAQFAAHAGA
jgi:CheY-like chemotaxis protein